MTDSPTTLRSRLASAFEWLPEIGPESLRADLTAAFTGAVLVIPQGVAFAATAGMPPQYGLYAAMVPTIVAALFGASRHLVSGPTTAASIVIYSAISALATPGSPEDVTLAITLAFLVGLVQLGLGLARMGVLVNFIPHCAWASGWKATGNSSARACPISPGTSSPPTWPRAPSTAAA